MCTTHNLIIISKLKPLKLRHVRVCVCFVRGCLYHALPFISSLNLRLFKNVLDHCLSGPITDNTNTYSNMNHDYKAIYFHICSIPIGSMYAIYGNIYHQYTPNVSIYTIHGSYGI